ncbi:MAG TPA: pilus assembly protein TadG-related protein [Tianweitania sediminis]|nr:pilus assembly protein TadG-related protein [Tianweitania sediminis]
MRKSFFSSTSGSYAVAFAVMLLPLCGAAGLAVDYTRQTSAKQHLQDIADAASLALASSKETNNGRLRQMAQDFLSSNQREEQVQQLVLEKLEASTESIDLQVAGTLPSTFMKLAGYETLAVRASSLAERAVRGNIEVALVLDNTKSMEADGGAGFTRIGALKSAANNMIDALLKNGSSGIRVALVPYADVVNVGVVNRNASWINVPSDKTTTKVTEAQPASCEMVSTERVKVGNKPKYSCTKTVDGAPFPSTCGGEAIYEDRPITPKEVCTKATAEKTSSSTTTWFGCVGSRIGGKSRLNDDGSTKYPGLNDTSQKCVTPIIRLTNDKAKLTAGISGMVTSLSGYAPNTFIPGGLIWGLNALSPDGPFGDGMDYDAQNTKPRKVAVLMTDGENTLLYNKSNGKATTSASKLTAAERQPYVAPPASGNCGGGNDGKADDTNGNAQGCKKGRVDPVGTGNYAQANEDTLAICTNMKAKGIEIFTVAFMVGPEEESLLKACATSDSHFYAADSSEVLADAFTGIAKSLQVVRLVR